MTLSLLRVNELDDFNKHRRDRYTIQEESVARIVDQVRQDGDDAIRRFSNEFDKIQIDDLRVSASEIKTAYSNIAKEQKAAIKAAYEKLATNEKALMNKLKDIEINKNGISKKFVPIESAGCYIPGGRAKYLSSAIMSITPAKIAGVPRIAVVTPPNKQGCIDSMTLVAADMCGADEIYKMGGAQAIAALSIGTKSVKEVNKIVGPGNVFVTLAKHHLSNYTAIDMMAGPTELGIIADDTADPNYVARDLISQAEHGPNTFCCLITQSRKLADDVDDILDDLVPKLWPTDDEPLAGIDACVILCKDIDEIVYAANKLALEHLQIIARDADKISEAVNTAGVILIGENTPSAASDYLLGSDHILPTDRFGRTRGPLSVLDFVKLKTTVRSDIDTLRDIAGPMKILTDAEGLPNHYNAVAERLKD